MDVVRESADLWKIIQLDKCQVMIQREPNKEDKEGWVFVYKDNAPEGFVPRDGLGIKHMCLFPKVWRIEPDGEATILFCGRGLFADSYLVALGILEVEAIERMQ